jgi:zinc/manganese transport system permease protein
VFALLVAPPATAQLITPRIGASLLLTVILGVAITWIGLALAYFFNYPVGFYVTTVAFAVYVVARLGRALSNRPGVSLRLAHLARARPQDQSRHFGR